MRFLIRTSSSRALQVSDNLFSSTFAIATCSPPKKEPMDNYESPYDRATSLAVAGEFGQVNTCASSLQTSDRGWYVRFPFKVHLRWSLTCWTDMIGADKGLRKYAVSIERVLSSWEVSPEEWADYIAFLARLLKVFIHSSSLITRLTNSGNPSTSYKHSNSAA